MTAQNIFGAYNLEIDIMMLFTLAMKFITENQIMQEQHIEQT